MSAATVAFKKDTLAIHLARLTQETHTASLIMRMVDILVLEALELKQEEQTILIKHIKKESEI